MMRAKDIKLAAVIGGIVILAVVGLIAWRQGGILGGTGKDLILFVDRGLSEKDKATFERQLADKQKEVDELAAKGERNLTKILQLGNLFYTVGNLEKSAEQYRDIDQSARSGGFGKFGAEFVRDARFRRRGRELAKGD